MTAEKTEGGGGGKAIRSSDKRSMSAAPGSSYPFCRWERIARQGALEALRNGDRRTKDDKREEWLVSEVNHLRTVVAELTAENLTLKRGLLV